MKDSAETTPEVSETQTEERIRRQQVSAAQTELDDPCEVDLSDVPPPGHVVGFEGPRMQEGESSVISFYTFCFPVWTGNPGCVIEAVSFTAENLQHQTEREPPSYQRAQVRLL